jgi:hypothetical protein
LAQDEKVPQLLPGALCGVLFVFLGIIVKHKQFNWLSAVACSFV